jgi:hypothetical protein
MRSSTNACTGKSSTVVTPRSTRCSITRGEESPAKRAAQRRRHVGVQHRVAAHVRFVEDRAHPGHVAGGGRSPHMNAVSTTTRLRHAERVVAPVEAQVGARRADAVAVVRVAPAQRPVRFRVRIEQQLVVVEAVAVRRIVRSVDAVAVERARPQPGR